MGTRSAHRPHPWGVCVFMVFILAVVSLVGYVGNRAAWLAAVTPAAGFPDLPTSIPEGAAAQYLRDRGVVSGMPNGRFHGEILLNRAQAAKLLLLASERQPDTDRIVFRTRDVEPGSWYADYIAIAWYLGIMQGYGDGEFRPDQNIVRAEFYKMLAVAFQFEGAGSPGYRDVRSEDWFAPYAAVARKHGLILRDDGQNFSPNRLVNRAEAAYALAKSMEIVRPTPEGAFFRSSASAVLSSASRSSLRSSSSLASSASSSRSSALSSARTSSTSSRRSSAVSSRVSSVATSRSSVRSTQSVSSCPRFLCNPPSGCRYGEPVRDERSCVVECGTLQCTSSSSSVRVTSSSVSSSRSSSAPRSVRFLDTSRAQNGDDILLCSGFSGTRRATAAGQGDAVSLQFQVEGSDYRPALFTSRDGAYERAELLDLGLSYQRTDISDDGRWFAVATVQDPSGGGGQADLYLYDREEGREERIAEGINSAGLDLDYTRVLQVPTFAISGNGQRVVFASPAQVTEDDTDASSGGPVDLFLWERDSGETRLLVNGDFRSVSDVDIDVAGETVAFVAQRTLAQAATARVVDVESGEVTIIPGSPSTGGDALRAFEVSISADGRLVAFTSAASHGAIETPWNGGAYTDVFVFDRDSGSVAKVNYGVAWTQSQTLTYPQADGDNNSFGVAMSGNGRYVAYLSLAKNLTGDDLNDSDDQRFHQIYIYDRDTDSTAVWDLPRVDDEHLLAGFLTGQRLWLNEDGSRLVTSLQVAEVFHDGGPGNTFGEEQAIVLDTESGEIEVLRETDSCNGGRAARYGIIRKR